MFKIVVLSSIVASLSVIMPLSAYAQGFFQTAPLLVDSTGSAFSSVAAGTEIFIFSTYTNMVNNETALVAFVEVRDESGRTVFLTWQTGVAELQDDDTYVYFVRVPWSSQEPAGEYQLRTFAITDFENPQVISVVATFDIEVKPAKVRSAG